MNQSHTTESKTYLYPINDWKPYKALIKAQEQIDSDRMEIATLRGTTMDLRHHSRDMEIPEDPMDRSKQNSSRQGNSNQPSYQRCPIFLNYHLV
eukprot:scaffold72964_cov58-Attheya_sp.AAC.2